MKRLRRKHLTVTAKIDEKCPEDRTQISRQKIETSSIILTSFNSYSFNRPPNDLRSFQFYIHIDYEGFYQNSFRNIKYHDSASFFCSKPSLSVFFFSLKFTRRDPLNFNFNFSIRTDSQDLNFSIRTDSQDRIVVLLFFFYSFQFFTFVIRSRQCPNRVKRTTI